MGYNNNYAGMHYKRWSGVYGVFDDGREIDRDAMMRRPLKCYKLENDEKSDDDKKESSLPSTTTYKRNRKKKKKTKQNQNVMPNKVQEEKKEYLVGLEHFGLGQDVSRNIIRIGLEKNLGIVTLLDNILDKMKRDYRVNNDLIVGQLNDHVMGYPKIEEIMIFLSVVADALNVPISEFFVEEPEKDREMAYKIVDENPYYCWEEITLTQDEYDSENYFDTYLENPNEDTESPQYKYWENSAWHRKGYGISRGVDSNGEYIYSLSYGDLYFRYDTTAEQYIMHGATLWIEKEGKIADLGKAVFENQVIIDADD